MKLDRNIEGGDGKGKYALLKLREVKPWPIDLFGTTEVEKAINTLQKHGLLEWGAPNTEGEFFVIKLRDAFAEGALIHYANTAMIGGEKEYAQEVLDLANRSGKKSPFCKRPD